jgi:hypothetical protein
MSRQHGRKKLTREERAKRNAEKAERRTKIRRVIKEARELAERAEDVKRRADKAGIELPDSEWVERMKHERG